MTMHPTEIALNDYVDGELPAEARAEVERHLPTCADCRATLAALSEVKRATAGLQPLAPPERAWERIRSGIESSGDVAPTSQAPPDRSATPASRWATAAWTTTWLAAAAVLLVAIGAAWYASARRTTVAPPATSASTTPAPDAQAVAAEFQQAEEHYQKAIVGLEQIANADKDTLDPKTAAALGKSLTVLDQAIGESRAALKQQPTSEPAQQSLLENFKTKLGVLEDTVALINEMRKGNEAGAARIASGLKQKD